MRAILSLIAVCLVGIFVYLLPELTATALIRQNLNPWLTCVVATDLAGGAALFLLGRRAMSLALCTALSLAEWLLLSFHVVAPLPLLWIAGAIPAALVAVVTVRTGLRNLAAEN